MEQRFKFSVLDFILDENGRFQFKIDGDVVGAINTAIRNIANEAKDVATSWTYNRYADNWEIDYQYKHIQGASFIKKVTLKNTDNSPGSQGASGGMMWNIMNEGRMGGYPIYPHHTRYLRLFENRFRTRRYRAETALGGDAQATRPLEQAYDVMEAGARELAEQIMQDSTNFTRVRVLGNTVFTNLFVPRGANPDAEYGDYGGEWRRDADYPLGSSTTHARARSRRGD